MSTILLTDGGERAALAAVRSLGRAGHRVLVCTATGRTALAGASRYAARDVRVAPPLQHPRRFVQDVREVVRGEDVDVVLPVAEASVLPLLAARDDLHPARIPFPDLGTFREVSDKAAVTEAAPAVGIAVPEQVTVEGPDALDSLDLEGLSFPAILKPARSVVQVGTHQETTSVDVVEDAGDLRRRVEEVPLAAFPVLVQERIVGPGMGVFLLLWDGRLLASFAHRRIREKPPSGGVSVLRESVRLPGSLRARSRRLLERFGWEGVAMVEFKIDRRTDRPVLMEVNGRFWGSLQLPIDAGVDFPALLIRALSGETPEPVHEYRAGVRTRWIWGDVDHLIASLRNGHASARTSDGRAGGRRRVVADFLRSFGPGSRNEVFRLSDPGPAVRETVGWLDALFG